MTNQQLITDLAQKIWQDRKCLFCSTLLKVIYCGSNSKLQCPHCNESVNLYYNVYHKIYGLLISCKDLAIEFKEYNNISSICSIEYLDSVATFNIKTYCSFDSPIINYKELFDKELLYFKLRNLLIFS